MYYLIDIFLLPALLVINLTWRGPQLRRRLKANRLKSKFERPTTAHVIIVEESARLVIDIPFSLFAVCSLWRFPALIHRMQVMRRITRRECDFYIEVLWFDFLMILDLLCLPCVLAPFTFLLPWRITFMATFSRASAKARRALGILRASIETLRSDNHCSCRVKVDWPEVEECKHVIDRRTPPDGFELP